MAKGMYIGISSKARKVNKAYIGVGGVARKIKKMYIGVGGVARLFYSALTATTKQVSVGYGVGSSVSLGLTSSELATVYGIKLTNIVGYVTGIYAGTTSKNLGSTDIINVEGATDSVTLYTNTTYGTLSYNVSSGTIDMSGVVGSSSWTGVSATATIYYYT